MNGRRGIEDLSLKSLYVRGNKSPHPKIHVLKGEELTSIDIKQLTTLSK
jgi:hypothetical protein